MGWTSLRRRLLAAATSALFAACSDGDAKGTRSRDLAPAGGASGQVPPAGGSGGNDFDNAAGATMVQPPTGGSLPMDPPPPAAEPIQIDACGADNPAGLSAEDAAKLIAGGGAGSLRVLYPYAGTVFPRGMLAPTIMWDGAGQDADAVYVHLVSGLFEYRGCLRPTAAGQLQLPQEIWEQAGVQTRGAADPFTLELSTLERGTVVGPATQQLTIAQATIKGSIYYNSYSSALGGMAGGGIGGFPIGGAGGSGIVLRIQPGGMAEAFSSTECNGCHSVSADGSRLISAIPGLGTKSFALTRGIATNPPSMNAGPKGAFGALFPDGSLYLAMSTVTIVGRSSLVADPTAPVDAALYRTDDGSVVPNTGIPTGVLMPTFSPSGRVLAFNDYAIGGPTGGAHGIAVMDFDVSSNTASNYRELFKDDRYRPGWPFTLPDDRAVIFVRTDGPDFSGDGAGLLPGVRGPYSDLYIADIASGTVTVLAQAMGYDTPDAAANDTYLPFGDDDVHGNYFPTVSPVAAGGYFWVFFDSLRSYGNLGVQRQLWGAAIDVSADGNYARDPSHPPFYLPGQEFGTGNHRAFAALDPCKQDGDACTSGTDCCGGFCFVPESDDEFGVEREGSCNSNVPECAQINERCTTMDDCCASAPGQPRLLCIASFCAVPVVE